MDQHLIYHTNICWHGGAGNRPGKEIMNKYHNKKTVAGGIRFDSKMEGERYLILRDMEKRGEITELQLQPKFQLQEGFRYHGKTVRAITYIADFMYKNSAGKIVVEDVKGVETKEFKIKKKMFLYQYGDRYDFQLVR